MIQVIPSSSTPRITGATRGSHGWTAWAEGNELGGGLRVPVSFHGRVKSNPIGFAMNLRGSWIYFLPLVLVGLSPLKDPRWMVLIFRMRCWVMLRDGVGKAHVLAFAKSRPIVAMRQSQL